MPYRKEEFINGEIYHIIVKALDDNVIFKDIDDHYRGIFSIYEFNTTKPVTIQGRRRIRASLKKKEKDRGRASINSGVEFVRDERDRLVEVLAFCIMPNHIHLLVRQLQDKGIVRFMSKFNTGYGGYYNRKNQRKGYVFQDRFTAVHIENDTQLKVVFVYIHTNPISLIEPKWKKFGIKKPKKAIEFIESYKWSSCSDYIGEKNFPSVTDRGFILETFGGADSCKELIEDWVKYKGEIKEFIEILLEQE